jgi:phosphoribosyl 1,2-cyclic phosphate phosphodiesterase
VSHPPVTITFLGTGTSTGIPMIGCNCEVCTSSNKKDKRLRSSILVESDTTSFVIDTTPDFRQQMLRINHQQLDAVLFTHPHKDHTAGLDDIRAYNYIQQQPIKVYANSLTIESLKRQYYYIFSKKKYPGIPQINLHVINEKPFHIGNIKIIPILVWHLNLPVYGFRINNFTYITDANRIDEMEKDKIRGSETIVLNALRKEKHISHFTLQEAIDLVHELNVPNAYFTHISHQLGLHEKINAELPKHIKLAYDNLTLQV